MELIEISRFIVCFDENILYKIKAKGYFGSHHLDAKGQTLGLVYNLYNSHCLDALASTNLVALI